MSTCVSGFDSFARIFHSRSVDRLFPSTTNATEPLVILLGCGLTVYQAADGEGGGS